MDDAREAETIKALIVWAGTGSVQGIEMAVALNGDDLLT